MPSFPVVSHSWLADIAIALLVKVVGFPGLFFTFSFLNLFILTFLFVAFAKDVTSKFLTKLFYWRSAILISSITVFFNFFYIRPQVPAWGVWALFVYFISNKQRFIKYRLLLPFLIFIWCNLHGDFAIANFLIVFITIILAIKEKKVDYTNIFVLILSFLATLINPFGINLWREVLSTYFNPYLRQNIMEWQPLFMGYFDLAFSFYAIFTTLIVWRYRKRFEIYLVFFYFILLIQAALSIKNIPLWVIFSFIFSYKGVLLLYKDLPNKISMSRFKIAGKFLLGMALVIFIVQVGITYSQLIFSPDISYPTKAVEYLHNNLPTGQIFSNFNWGGYLIWKLPEKKDFLDGRMVIWNWNANIPSETNNAFRDYLDILSGKMDFEIVFAKYKIDTVLWSPKKSINKSSIDYKISEYMCQHFQTGCLAITVNEFGDKLLKAGWHMVYQDKVAVIYKR